VWRGYGDDCCGYGEAGEDRGAVDAVDSPALQEIYRAEFEYAESRLHIRVFANGRIVELSVAKEDESVDLGRARRGYAVVHHVN